MNERMPPLAMSGLDERQRKAAEALIAGPRKAVLGPFIPLLRSPELMDRMQRVGEYLRFDNALPGRLTELAIAITARHVDNAFEWAVHRPLAAKAGVSEDTLVAIGERRRPAHMPDDDALVHDFVVELLTTHFVGDARYEALVARFGERGVVDLVATVGYFLAISLVMNVAGTPPPAAA
jgi:4-carboxymuconolactone decarboxylase